MNADDFGQSRAINEGVIRAHDHGIVTSASLMVRWPEAERAAAYARTSSLAVGLHVDLGEAAMRLGRWTDLYRVAELTDGNVVRAEIARQLDRFRSLVGRDPTHLDSHQHVHMSDVVVGSTLDEIGEQLEIAVRGRSEVIYCGAFYGQERTGEPAHERITRESLIDLIGTLPDGATELACHPATGHDTESMYGVERALELDALCDSDVRRSVEQASVRLATFAELPRSFLCR